MKKNNAWFKKGNSVAKKPDRRCFYCDQDISRYRKDAIFCCDSHKVLWNQKLTKYKLIRKKYQSTHNIS